MCVFRISIVVRFFHLEMEGPNRWKKEPPSQKHASDKNPECLHKLDRAMRDQDWDPMRRCVEMPGATRALFVVEAVGRQRRNDTPLDLALS